MTYVVVGGGATGVETAGAIAGLLRLVIPTDYPSLRAVEWKVVILEAGPKLLGHMSHEMARLALAEMKNAGVEIRLNTRAASVTGDQVATDSGEILRTRSVIWAAGVRVPDVISAMPTKHGHHGSIVVDEYLRISGDSHAYAIGDNAHFVNPQTGKPVPLLAATAMQQGETTGANIVRTLRNKPLRSFRYRNLGNVVSVGRRSGVAEIGGRVIGGFAGWVAWRVVHVARLTSMRNQLATALDWTVGYFYDVDTARLDLTAKRAA
jgi:NADH dehydrogenase